MDDIRYPIGKFNPVENVTEDEIKNFITQLEKQPVQARRAIEGLTEEQIDTSYREGGWTLRQVVHHIADTNMNSYIRFKLALTEDNPTVKVWNETAWAQLEDAQKAPVDLSLSIIEAVNMRLVMLLKQMSVNDFDKKMIHPEMGDLSLSKNLQLYDWHELHHISQITSYRQRMNW